MNVSKTFAAAIAATAIVGAGFGCAQTTNNPSTDAAAAPPAAPADARTAVIAPADTQREAAQDSSMQAPIEGSQGTQSGPVPTDTSSSVAPTYAPVSSDSTTASGPVPKADRN